MGHTHYFTIIKRPTQEQWTAIQAAMNIIFRNEKLRSLIQFEYDDNMPPVVNDTLVRFNGIEDDGHETFFLSREDWGFQFCKTAEKPYDMIVTAALIIANHFASDCYDIKSDGKAEDWEAGKVIAEGATGVVMKIPIS